MSGPGTAGFATVLRQHRLAAGLTQEALAERSGLGVRSIQGLERGESQPRLETLRRLTEALGLTGEQVVAFEFTGQPSPRRRRLAAPIAVARPDSAADARARHNLPVQLTTFVGRARERAELIERLAGTRLLTLTGTGGCGKTRLALAVASDAAADFADGVWLVDLAPLSDPDMIAKAVATAVGVREAADTPVRDTLLAALRSRQPLLVLDNCEHLIAGCAGLVDALLRACPDVMILATSREPLGIDGEVAWRVPSLSVAPDERTTRPGRLMAYEAVQLFVERAQAAEPTFVLTAQNAAAVSQVCRRLDGIPLAVELAARRVRALSPEQIADRLDRRFELLTGGSRAAFPRQQTLAATVEWSYHLLPPNERALFDRLAPFAGVFTLEAVESIADDRYWPDGAGGALADSPAPDRDAASGPTVLDGLAQLVEKSLVVADPAADGARQYRLLETLRQYARERLAATGNLEEIGRRHAVYYLHQAEEASQHLQGHDQVRWLNRLDRDHANLHAALRWTIEGKQADLAMRLAASLGYFWYFRGHHTESRALRAAVLSLPDRSGLAGLRAQVLQSGAMLALHQGDYASARGFLAEAVGLAREVRDRRLLASALWTVGFVTRVECDYASARAALEEGLAEARAVGDSFHTAMSLHHLGLLALEAQADAEACWTLNEECLALHREAGNRRMIGVTLLAMGRAARARGDGTTARALIMEAITLHEQVGDAGHVPHMLYQLAALDAEAGRLDRAVRVAGCAAALIDAMGARAWPVIERERDAWLAPARHALGEAAFGRAWGAGQAMTREQAITACSVDGSTVSGSREHAVQPGRAETD